MKKRLMSVLLALVMVIGVLPTAAFATGEKETINYVSIGDSMANGYGFKGYNQSNSTSSDYNFEEGLNVYGVDSYPEQFEDYLVGLGYQVNHTKLASSAMLPEHLLYLLSDTADNFYEMPTGNYTGFLDYIGNLKNDPAKVKKHFQDAVANADVITMGIGNATFGAFLMDYATRAMDIVSSPWTEAHVEEITLENALELLEDEEQKVLVQEIYDSLIEEMEQYVDLDILGETDQGTSKLETICDIMAYSVARFLVSYEGILEQIDVLNDRDHLEVILVGLMNTLSGIVIVDEDGEELLPLGEVTDVAFGALNAYIAALATKLQSEEGKMENISFYYGGEMSVECFCDIFEEIYDNGWDKDYEDDRVDPSILHDRTVDAVVNMVLSNFGVTKTSLKQALQNESALKTDPTTNAQALTIVGIYKGIEQAVAKNMNPQLPLSSLTGLSDLRNSLGSIFDMDEISKAYQDGWTEEEYGRDGVAAVQDYVFSILDGDDSLKGMCTVFGLFQVGNGMSVHPTPAGHDDLAASVIAAYEDKHTASDETVENLKEAYQFLLEHYEEIYKIAYQVALDAGYIAQANELLDEVEAGVRAIEVSGLSAELQAEVQALMAEILDDIDAIRAIVNSPEHPTAEFYALVNDLAEDLAALQKVGAQAGKELYAAVLALQAKLDQAFEEALEAVDAQLREAYEAVVDALTDLAEEYGPAAEAFLRTWLIDNPKAIMDAIVAYGRDIDAFVNHWSYYVELILGPAWNAYGDDLVALIEDLLDTLNRETAGLTDQAAAELLNYIKGLDLDTQMEAIAQAVMNGSVTIGEETLTELKDIVEDLSRDIDTSVDAVVDALEDLASSKDAKTAKAVIEAAIQTVLAKEAELKEQIKAIEKDIEDVEAQLKDAAAFSDQIPDIVKKLRYLFNNPEEIADLSKTIADVQKVLKTICGTVESVQEAASLLVTLTNDITAAAKEINAELIALNGELETAVGAIETTLTAAGVDAEALLVETWAAIDAFVTATADTVITDASALVAACELELTAAVNEFIAAIETALYKATHGDVTVDCVATYTAIGDEADAYTSALAEKLGVKVAPLSAETDLVTIEFGVEELSAFVNSQIAGMITDVVMDNETLVSWLNDPTIGPMVKDVLAGYGFDLTAEVAPLAWEKYLDETAIAVKDETLDGIATVLMDHDVMMETYSLDLGEMIESVLPQGISVDCVVEIPVAELLVAAVDNLLYAYVDTAAQCVATIEGIQETAPEAEVVILGLTNAAEELKIKIGNTEIDLGEYEDAIGTFANAHYFAYALLNGENTTFVADKDAEAIYAALNVTDLGHEWTAVVTAPTCTEAGYTTYTCAKCGETYTENGDAATGHAFGAWTDNGDGTHSRVCANDASHVETADHDFTNGDCVCGAKKPVEEDDKPSGGGGGGSSRKWHCPTCKTDICHSKAFSDLDLNAWYHEYTDYVLCKGMMNGMGGGIFAPNGETSRAMLTTIIYRIAGSPAVSGEMPFADVAAGQWYTDAILWAAENDIVLGYGDGNFGPMDTITREQIAALFFRFAELEGMKTNKSADLSAYNDANTIGAWAVDYVEWAVASGLMQGRSAHLLAPAAGTTRAETAALLERWCEEIAK